MVRSQLTRHWYDVSVRRHDGGSRAVDGEEGDKLNGRQVRSRLISKHRRSTPTKAGRAGPGRWTGVQWRPPDKVRGRARRCPTALPVNCFHTGGSIWNGRDGTGPVWCLGAAKRCCCCCCNIHWRRRDGTARYDSVVGCTAESQIDRTIRHYIHLQPRP